MRALFGTIAATMLAVVGLVGAVGQAGLTRQFAEASKVNVEIPRAQTHASPLTHNVPAVAGWLAEVR